MAKANPFTRVRNLTGTARSAHPDKLRQKMNKGILRWKDVVPTVPALQLKRYKRKQKPLYPGPLKRRNKAI
jgi:hypothetical protein